MANDQTAEELLTSLVEYVGMQMLRVEGLSHRSWRYVLVATPTEDGNFGPEMRASYMQTDRVSDDLRTFAALLEDVAQRMEAQPSSGTPPDPRTTPGMPPRSGSP
jgi:hypothetical protein